jgi:glutathione S-transferase
MKLFYLPGACSLAPHIALREAGIAFDLVRVGRDKQTADGRDFLTINPYGYVPALELDDGRVLLEGPAIMQYLADLAPAAGLAPANGSFARYQLQAMLTFINSELHKPLGGLFRPGLAEEAKAEAVARVDARLKTLSSQMGERPWLVDEHYSVADMYLFVVLGWLRIFKLDIQQWPVLAAHSARVAARPAVQDALKAEGLA